MRRILLLLLFFGALWLFGARAGHAVRDFVTRGKRLTRSTLAGGVVQESIADLVAEAGATLGRAVDRRAYVVARMLRSEYGGGPVAAKIAMAHVAVNDAAQLGWDVERAVCFGTGDRLGERFGAQSGKGNDDGTQRYGTSLDPYENDLQIAEAVLGGELPDPTGGAVKFVHVNALGQTPSGAANWTHLTGPHEVADGGLLRVYRPRGVA